MIAIVKRLDSILDMKIADRKVNRILYLIMIACAIFFSIYFIDRFSYANEKVYKEVNFQSNDSILTIGIIGDSWVSGNKIDTFLKRILFERNINARIISSGQPGAKSKLIYKNLFKNSKQKYSSKFIIEYKPEYCVVIAGVNDAASQIGGGYYSYHMEKIIRLLLKYDIQPIIVTLPEFGIEETIKNMNVLSRYRNIISAYINNGGEIDNILSYRRKLFNRLNQINLADSVIWINFDQICRDYKNDLRLYYNPSHLSKEGNKRLAQEIGTEILLFIYKKNGNIRDVKDR